MEYLKAEYKEFFKPDEIRRIGEIETLPRQDAIRELEKDIRKYAKKSRVYFNTGAALIALTGGTMLYSVIANDPVICMVGMGGMLGGIFVSFNLKYKSRSLEHQAKALSSIKNELENRVES